MSLVFFSAIYEKHVSDYGAPSEIVMLEQDNGWLKEFPQIAFKRDDDKISQSASG